MPREKTQDDTLNMDTKPTQETAKLGALRSGDLFGDGDFSDYCEDSDFGNELCEWLHAQKKRITTRPNVKDSATP